MAGEGIRQYPHSSPAGVPLPFDVGSQYGYIWTNVTDTDSDSFTIPNANEEPLVAVFAARGCPILVNLSDATAVLSTRTFSEDIIWVPHGGQNKVFLGNAAVTMRALCPITGGAGRLDIMVYRAWKSGGIDALQSSI